MITLKLESVHTYICYLFIQSVSYFKHEIPLVLVPLHIYLCFFQSVVHFSGDLHVTICHFSGDFHETYF